MVGQRPHPTLPHPHPCRQAPPDLIRTVAYGTLLYDSGCSEAELGLALPYRDIAASFQEAVECVKRHDAQRVAGARP